MTNLIGAVLGAFGVAGLIAALLAYVRFKGQQTLVDLMEQRIRIQDGEIARLQQDLKREREQSDVLTDKFVASIVAAVVQGVNRSPR